MAGNILWSIDPAADLGLNLQCLSALRTLVNSGLSPIQPVCVVPPEPPGPATSQKAFEDFVAKLKLPTLLPPRIIVSRSKSNAGKAKALARFAAQENARLCLVGSHGRTGLSRLLMGSFTESLILKSKLPVYVLSPQSYARTDRIERILFPTDFSSGVPRGLEAATQLARELGAELVIYFKNEGKRALDSLEQGSHWSAWAASQGVNSRFALAEGSDSVPKSIVEFAEENNCGMITMLSQAGAVRAAVLGSTARAVARVAHCPVWIQHTD